MSTSSPQPLDSTGQRSPVSSTESVFQRSWPALLRRFRQTAARWLPSRFTMLKIWCGIALASLSIVLLVFNSTVSLPLGLYLRLPPSDPLQSGTIVSFCLTSDPASFGVRRGYVPKSSGVSAPTCPEGSVSLLKRVVAGPGDTVRVGLDGIAVNGRSIGGPPPHCDPQQRRIPIQYGTHVLGPRHYWLSTDQYLSYDSRIYGPVHRSQIFARAYPLLTYRPDPPDRSLYAPTLALQRVDCRQSVSSDQPLLEQVRLLRNSASLDSLRRRARRHPFHGVSSLHPPLRFSDVIAPPGDTLRARHSERSTFLPARR